MNSRLKNTMTAMKTCSSASGSGAAFALICVAYLLLSPHKQERTGASISYAPAAPTPSRLRVPHVDRVSSRIDWLDSVAEPTEPARVCRSRNTETRTFGAIRLIDVGDAVENLSDFLAVQAHRCAERHEKCLVAAFLPTCPSCSSMGYALATEQMGRFLGPLTLIRIDVEEFEQDLQELGFPTSQVPAFALLNATGKISDVLDSDKWPSNDPAEFLPVLAEFIRASALHQRGGRHRAERSGLVNL
jgi:hypothetical protein